MRVQRIRVSLALANLELDRLAVNLISRSASARIAHVREPRASTILLRVRFEQNK